MYMKKQYIEPTMNLNVLKIETLLLGTTFETDVTDNTGGGSNQPGKEDEWNDGITTAKRGTIDWDF